LHQALREVVDDLFVIEQKMRVVGMEVPCRMVIVRRQDGSLWLHSPIDITNCREALEKLGPIAWRVAPNSFHHLFQKPFESAFPDSRLAASARLQKKRTDLRIDMLLDDAPPDAFAPEISLFHLSMTPGGETVFLHHPSRSLITTDLAIAMDRTFGCAARLYGRLVGICDRFGVSKGLRFLYKDKKVARTQIDQVLSLDFDRIVPAHGPLIEKDAKAALKKAFEWL